VPLYHRNPNGIPYDSMQDLCDETVVTDCEPGLLDPNNDYTTDWTTDKCCFIPSKGEDFPILHAAETSSAAHVAYYPVVTGGRFPRCKVDET
jgi:hypothetical protein